MVVTTAGADLFLDDYSQERTVARATWPATAQWHGGNARSAADDFDARGGLFLPEEGIRNLGLDPTQPPRGATRIRLKFETKREEGWGFDLIHLAILQSAFGWEDRETRQRFPREEYRRRRESGDGSEQRLRGRLYVLTVARELLDAGADAPLLVTMRGTYSRALDGLIRDALGTLATTATTIRNRAGRDGAVPREAFWLPVAPAPFSRVGSGTNTSEVALPTTTLPHPLPTTEAEFVALARPLLVQAGHTRTDGTFDRLCRDYRTLWDGLAAFGNAHDAPQRADSDVPEEALAPVEAPPASDAVTARAACLSVAAARQPDKPTAALARDLDAWLERRGIAPIDATAADYAPLLARLSQPAAPALRAS